MDFFIDFLQFTYHFFVISIIGLILFFIIPEMKGKIEELEIDNMNLKSCVRAHEELVLQLEEKI